MYNIYIYIFIYIPWNLLGRNGWTMWCRYEQTTKAQDSGRRRVEKLLERMTVFSFQLCHSQPCQHQPQIHSRRASSSTGRDNRPPMNTPSDDTDRSRTWQFSKTKMRFAQRETIVSDMSKNVKWVVGRNAMLDQRVFPASCLLSVSRTEHWNHNWQLSQGANSTWWECVPRAHNARRCSQKDFFGSRIDPLYQH